MADEIAPVDGPRRDYSVPTLPDRRDSGFGVDSKGGTGGGGGSGGLGRRVSERLFPQNGTGAGIGSGRHSRQSSSEDDRGGGANAVPALAADPAGQGVQGPPQRMARKPTLPPSFEESTNGNGGRR